MNAMLFNYIGALQRDAPPSAVKGEPLAAPPKAYDVQVGTKVLLWWCMVGADRLQSCKADQLQRSSVAARSCELPCWMPWSLPLPAFAFAFAFRHLFTCNPRPDARCPLPLPSLFGRRHRQS